MPYIPGLDGLRAIAVLAVLLYHADLPPRGGFLGVESFFVVSGFLITALLLADHSRHGRVGLKLFWWRRARRLLPALFVLLVGVALLSVTFVPGELRRLGGDTLAALAYVTNWSLIAGGQSYFDAADRPPLLQHLWSLAVEEQFYIVWPLIFAAGMRFLGPRRLLALTLLGAAASLGLMSALFEPGADPSRIYYGTDTRAGGLLIGVALAFVWAPGRAPALAQPWAGKALDAGGFLALAGLVAAYVLLSDRHPLLYRGGIALVALATAALVAAATHPSARLLPRLLELPPLRWVGLRSYSLYLWHWPVFMLTRPGLDLPLTGWPLQALRFGLAFGLAALSYRFVELPIRQGALGRAWENLRREPLWSPRAGYRLWGPIAATVLLSLGVSYIGASIGHAAVLQRRGTPQQQAQRQAAIPPAGSIALVPGTPMEQDAGSSDTPQQRTAAAATATAAAPANEAAPSEPTFDRALADELQSILDATTADGEIPGVVLSVRLPNGTTWAGASGIADREADAAMTNETRVRIGSLSKMFTAVTVLQLVEEGSLALDEPVATWLPDLLPDGDQITVRQLLQHTSGLYDYLEDRSFVAEAYAEPGREWAPEELVAYANEFPPTFEPGAEDSWDYSNTNFVVLGMLIERVTGNSFSEELSNRIFEPLGLKHTYAIPPDNAEGPQARGYSRDEDRAEVSLTFGFGTANIVSTAADLRRFGEALFDGELLAPETSEQMQRFVNGNGQYNMPNLEYGLGLMANRLPLGPSASGRERSTADAGVLGHIGGINGFRSALWYAPERKILIALSVNQGSVDPNDLATVVLDTLLTAQGR